MQRNVEQARVKPSGDEKEGIVAAVGKRRLAEDERGGRYAGEETEGATGFRQLYRITAGLQSPVRGKRQRQARTGNSPAKNVGNGFSPIDYIS